jgi:hypothetical protein
VPGVRGEGVKKKRWTLKLALCLLAGAVVTWGVAWGCATWGPAGTEPAMFVHRLQDGTWTEWCIHDGSRGRQIVFWAAISSDRGIHLAKHAPRTHQVISRPPSPLLGVAWSQVPNKVIWTLGWPLTSHFWVMGGPPPWMYRWSATTFSWLLTEVAVLGFALNTLFYAAVLLGAVECVAFARRRVRRGKGRCPSCGYDRAGLAEGSACPECGGKA